MMKSKKKIIPNKKQIAIKRIITKFKRLKNHNEVRLKIICSIIDYL